MNAFIQQGCIKWIKSEIKDMARSWFPEEYWAVFSTDKIFFMSNESAYGNDFWFDQIRDFFQNNLTNLTPNFWTMVYIVIFQSFSLILNCLFINK